MKKIKTMKKKIKKTIARLSLGILLVIGLISCQTEYSTEYSIVQKTTEGIEYNKPCLVTLVWRVGRLGLGEILWSRYDELSNPAIDSIKCVRYKQAQNFVEKCKRLDEIKCKSPQEQK